VLSVGIAKEHLAEICIMVKTMDSFEYSEDFYKSIVHFHRGKEHNPDYTKYLNAHLGGPTSRVVMFTNVLCPRIEQYCGSLKNKRVLDFGCGTGATTVALAQYCDHVVAFDISKESIEIAKRRVGEHRLQSKIQFYVADDLDDVRDSMGTFDLILIEDVIEHIPLSQKDLRKRLIRTLFNMLNESGYIYINDTANRLWPFDGHTTQLWWIPWSKPGSKWAYERAIRKGRHSDYPTISKGPLGLEQRGAWGTTYWDIRNYLKGQRFVCLNTISRNDRPSFHLSSSPKAMAKVILEYPAYYLGTKVFHIPKTAFGSALSNLVIQKR
jgi:2-polyprenyl-3-methyl-5-hydroxy-6-metoxy-1,4-benzoquinol methylase